MGPKSDGRQTALLVKSNDTRRCKQHLTDNQTHSTKDVTLCHSKRSILRALQRSGANPSRNPFARPAAKNYGNLALRSSMTWMIRGARNSLSSSQSTAMPLSITRSLVMAFTCFIVPTKKKASGFCSEAEREYCRQLVGR